MSDHIIENPKELAKDIKAVENALLAVKAALKDFGTESSGIEKLSKEVKGLGGAFSAAKESLTLFGAESKSLSEIESKIKSVTEIVGGLQVAFKTLGKTGGWLTVISVAVAGLTEHLHKLKEEQNHVNKSRQAFKDINLNAEKSIAKQRTEITSLTSIANDYSKSLDIRKKAVEKLNELMPDYNGYIDEEGKLIGNTDDALYKYLDTLYKVSQAKDLIEKISNIDIKINEKLSGPEVSLNYLEQGWAVLSAPFKGKKSFQIRTELIEAKRQANKNEISELRKEQTEYQNKVSEIFNGNSVIENMFGNRQIPKNTPNPDSYPEKKYITDNKNVIDNNDLENQRLVSEKKINTEMRALAVKNISDRIALMDEGTQKELVKIEERYNQIIAEIRQREQEWRDAQEGELTDEQIKLGQEERLNAANQQLKDEEEVINRLTDKYKDYTAQRKDIEERYNLDLADLRILREKAVEDENDARVRELDRMINNLVAKQGKELMTFDFNVLKENPDFSWAFDNIKNTSTETLNVLLEQLNAIKDSNEGIDPTKLKEYSEAVRQVIDELATRNPVAVLANAQNQLTQANSRLAKAKQELDTARASGDTEAEAKAEKEYAEALIEVDKANKDVIKSQKVVNEKMGELFKNLSGIGEAIGGQAGEIISLIGDIGSFVTTSISGIQKAGEAGAGALAAVEKASAILAIIQVAIQLVGKISSMMSDTHQQYEKYAKKVAEINKLRDAVNDYEIAVLKAKQAEENWFAENNLKSLKDAKDVNIKAKKNYEAKANEEQATYVNKSGGGWFTKWVKEAFLPTTMIAHGDIGGGVAAFKGLKDDKYDKDTSRAVDNLRIETRKAKKGFLGSGIGGKSQKTEDLRTWARNNDFGELFDEDNMINKEAAQQIIDKYGDKLVGETKETLEALIDLREQYEEYQQQLRDYVSSLYEPLVDNFVDSLWAWFDEGKDALTSFKEMASGTFRDIVSDMMKTIVLEKIVGSYSDDIVDMYNEYAEGKLSEEQLMDKVARRTDEMIDTYEEQLPALQNIMTTLGNSLNDAGIDIKKKEEEKEQTAEKGSFQTMSQETGTELLGQFTAIRIHTSNIHELIKGMEREDKLVNNCLTAIEKNTFNTVGELKEVNNKLKQLKVEGIKVL